MTDQDGGARATSTTQLIRTAAEQLSRLVRAELALARAEFAAKARHAAVGVGLLTASGAVGFYGTGAVLVTVGLLLTLVVPAWLASLIVTVGCFAAAGLLALLGRNQVRRVGSMVPRTAVDSITSDVRTVTKAVSDRPSP